MAALLALEGSLGPTISLGLSQFSRFRKAALVRKTRGDLCAPKLPDKTGIMEITIGQGIGILGATVFIGVGGWLVYSMKRGIRDERALTNAREEISTTTTERVKMRKVISNATIGSKAGDGTSTMNFGDLETSNVMRVNNKPELKGVLGIETVWGEMVEGNDGHGDIGGCMFGWGSRIPERDLESGERWKLASI